MGGAVIELVISKKAAPGEADAAFEAAGRLAIA